MVEHYRDDWLTIYGGDCREVLREMPAESVHCVVTSPPYWGLRDYGTPGQLGLEATPEEYVAAMVDVFREVRRVLRADGTVWLNLGDSYAGGTQTERNDGGLKPKDLVGIPWRVAFALQADGWYLRSDIIWAKPNPMPESVTDRPTKSHEYLFLLAKSARYYFDADAVAERRDPAQIEWRERYGETVGEWGRRREVEMGRPNANTGLATQANGPTRNIRSVWTIATAPYPGAHFATFPPKLVEPCIKAGCPQDGTVLDPFAGTGTVGVVAQNLSRRAVLIDLNPDYLRQCLARNAAIPLGLETA